MVLLSQFMVNTRGLGSRRVMDQAGSYIRVASINLIQTKGDDMSILRWSQVVRWDRCSGGCFRDL